MSDKVTRYCNALELQGCQSRIMLGVYQSDLVQTHQIIGYTYPAKGCFGGSKFFTAKAVKAITLFQFPDLCLGFGPVAVEFSRWRASVTRAEFLLACGELTIREVKSW